MSSRFDIFLKAIKTGDISNLPKPQSRIEYFLNAIATGDNSNLPKPQSRNEILLEHIALNGSSSGGNNDYSFLVLDIKEIIKNEINFNRINEKISIEVVEA